MSAFITVCERVRQFRSTKTPDTKNKHRGIIEFQELMRQMTEGE
jgi:hypothetical protein